MAEVKFKARKDGPYMIPGPVKYVDADGVEQIKSGVSVSLCRCGGSAKKPLCDGTHRKIEFQAHEVEMSLGEG